MRLLTLITIAAFVVSCNNSDPLQVSSQCHFQGTWCKLSNNIDVNPGDITTGCLPNSSNMVFESNGGYEFNIIPNGRWKSVDCENVEVSNEFNELIFELFITAYPTSEYIHIDGGPRHLNGTYKRI